MEGNTTFNFLSNLPLLVFSFAFLVVFVLFIRGGILLLLVGEEDEEKTEKGRAIVLKALYSLFALLLIVFVFFSVTYLLKKGEVLLPTAAPGDFPPSPDVNFPPPPQFIKVGEYSFTGPWLFDENNVINKPAIYTILCKKNENYDPSSLVKGEGYDIIHIGDTGSKEQLLKNKEYSCWVNNCKLKDIYLAVLFTPTDKYPSERSQKIREELKSQINPPCPVPEPNNET